MYPPASNIYDIGIWITGNRDVRVTAPGETSSNYWQHFQTHVIDAEKIRREIKAILTNHSPAKGYEEELMSFSAAWSSDREDRLTDIGVVSIAFKSKPDDDLIKVMNARAVLLGNLTNILLVGVPKFVVKTTKVTTLNAF